MRRRRSVTGSSRADLKIVSGGFEIDHKLAGYKVTLTASNLAWTSSCNCASSGTLSGADPFIAYSWFVGFAPAEHPEVAFAVLLGNAKGAPLRAHQVAKERQPEG